MQARTFSRIGAIVCCALFFVNDASAASPLPSFSRDLRLGDTGSDVRALQQYLNAHGFPIAISGPGSPGNETETFGPRTKAALILFQEAHAAEVLAPLGLTRGTGNFLVTTRRALLSAPVQHPSTTPPKPAIARRRSTAPTANTHRQSTVAAPQSKTATIRSPAPRTPPVFRHSGGGGGGGGGGRVASSSSSVRSSITPTIVLSDISKNFGDANFDLSPTSDSSGAFSYTIDNASVATVSGRTVTVVGSGSAIITITQAADGGYAAGSKTATIIVHAIAPTITFGNISKTYGNADFSLSPTSNSTGTFSFASSNTSVATIATSTVTITGAGSTTVTATQTANGNYSSGTATATLTVAKASSTLTLASNNNPNQFSESVKLTATITTGATGIITFYSGSTVLGTGAIIRGSGSLTSTTLKRGTGSLTAVFAGDTNFNSCTSNTLTQRVYRNMCLQAGLCRNGGTCSNVGDGFSCACVAPYSGTRCDLSDSFCNASHGGTNCFNGGTCIPTTARGECQCPDCYSGTFCDTYDPSVCA